MGRYALAAMMLILAVGRPATAGAQPDWNRSDDPLAYGMGLHAGLIGGSGLAFMMPVKWFLQVQVAGVVWNTADDHRNDVGIELHYLLRQDPRLRLYLAAGAARYSHAERRTRTDGSRYWDDETHFNSGFGVGIERLLGERWSVKLDLDFTHEGDGDALRPWPQAGVFFYW